MSPRRLIALATCAGALAAPVSTCAYSEGSPEQVAWVRRAAGNFVAAELSGNGAGACAVLDASLRRTERGSTCARRRGGGGAGPRRTRLDSPSPAVDGRPEPLSLDRKLLDAAELSTRPGACA